MSDTMSLPNCEWKECKLGDIAELIKDKYSPQKGDGLHYIGLKHIQKQSLRLNGIGCSDDITSDKFYFKEGDILFGKLGPYFRKVIMPKFSGVCSTDIWVVRSKNEVNQKYLFYLFANKEFVDLSNSGEAGTLMPRADWNFMSQSLWNIPRSANEQKAIAAVLSSLDDKIDLLHRQNKTLEAMAETLFRQWFVEEAEEDWEYKKLGEILTVIESGSRPKGGINPDLKTGIPSLGAESINGIGNYNHTNTKYITSDFFEKMKRGKVEDYDVLIYKDGAYIGKKSMFAKGFPFQRFAINEHVFILRTGSIFLQLFLYFSLEQDELALLNANSAQPGLNQTSMKSFEIFVPDRNYIEIFGKKVKPLIDKMFFNGIQIYTLEKLRDTLLPKLMSDKVRVEYENKRGCD
ncbi:MAG: restriction endonuclease subunit S [Desulfotomaculum sp.]|nr:restriction endonuclease subunit S [Desulfotomaculum sp.]